MIQVKSPMPCTDQDVDALVARSGIAIPSDLRTFWESTSNGGWLVEDLTLPHFDFVGLEAVLGVGRSDDQYLDLERTLRFFDQPDWLVPFGLSAGGNFVSFSTRESDVGSVWFWDHEYEDGDPTLLSGSIAEFFAGLVAYDFDDLPDVTVISVSVKRELLE